LDLLKAAQAPALCAVDTLETKRQTCMVQFQNRVVDERIELGLVEQIEKSHAPGSLAEKAAQHAVLRPNMTIFGRNMLDDIIGCGAQDIFRIGCLLLRNAG
jgi:hypothetical protein